MIKHNSKGNKIRFPLRISKYILLAFVVGCVVLAIVFSWRLSNGPISLSFLSSHIEEKLESIDVGVGASIGQVELFWKGWGNPIELRVQDVKIIKANTLEGKVPEILTHVSPPSKDLYTFSPAV